MEMAVVGDAARIMDAIPVERPQDIAGKGKGKIIKFEENKLYGKGTIFTQEVKVNDSILLEGSSSSSPPTVSKIISNTELILKFPPDIQVVGERGYKVNLL